MAITLVWDIGKYALIGVLAFVGYNVYSLILLPLMARGRFAKFRNVHVSPKFTPVLGDADKYIEDMNNGKATHYHQIEYALNLKGVDLRVSTMGRLIIVNLFSAKAIKEFQEKCPGFIDRRSIANTSFGKMFPGSALHLRSTEHWQKRREMLMKEIGINQASRFIPCILDAIGSKVKQWKVGKSYDLLDEIADATFTIISVILFGKNVHEEIGDMEYVNIKTGEIEKLKFNKFFTQLSGDVMSVRFNFKTVFLPFLYDYDLTSPFNTNKRNILEMWRVLRDYLNKSSDVD